VEIGLQISEGQDHLNLKKYCEMTAKISNKFSQEFPRSHQTRFLGSHESPEFRSGFAVNKRSPRHSKEWAGETPNIWSLISSVSGLGGTYLYAVKFGDQVDVLMDEADVCSQ